MSGNVQSGYKSRSLYQKGQNTMLELFYKVVYENWYPKALFNKSYKMYTSVKFVIDALLAMAED